jgi:hypothetical protein
MKTQYNSWYKKAQSVLPVLPVQLVQPINETTKKTFLSIEKDILSKSNIPKNELGDYITDTLADGAILREKAKEVENGQISTEDAAKTISQDWKNKKEQPQQMVA